MVKLFRLGHGSASEHTMQRIFLSFHFDEAGQKLADMVSELVKSHGLQAISGVRLGGRDLSDEIKQRIEGCDGLICLLTERGADFNNNWVRDERAHAAANGKWIIAVVQEGVNDGGLYQNREHISYDEADPVPALLKLSATIGQWRQEAGRVLVAEVEPEDAVQFLAQNSDYAKIKFRCWNGPDYTEWREEATVRPVGAGLHLYLRGIRDNQAIQVLVKNGEQTWESASIEPVIRLPLQRR